ncbi:MAG: HEPN domain-containing protein [Lachnospiraceae bacterium]|nr:HEPN domain-containing protein [Lachnospiraceae bacterium]
MADEYVLDAKEWLSYAEADLGVAEHLFNTYHPKPLEIICFHCQQAAEKAVKSIIVLKGSQGGLPKKHDLFLLLNQIKNFLKIDEKYYDYSDILSPYGVAMRYPNELMLEEHHAEKALRIGKEFVEWSKDIIFNAEDNN